MKGFLAKGALLLASLCIGPAGAELALRYAFGVEPLVVRDVRSQFFQHDPELGWIPRPASSGTFVGATSTTVRHNSRGFRDREHGPKTKPRVVVLGDSFVWGYDVERRQLFTVLLDRAMPHVEVWNLGVSGYGTDQSYLLLRRHLEELEPDAVILVFTPRNDFEDNMTNVRHGYYYKPYLRVARSELQLEGVPVPRSAAFLSLPFPVSVLEGSALFHSYVLARLKIDTVWVPDPTLAILAHMNRLLGARGVRFLVGMVDESQAVEAFLNRHEIPVVSLATRHQFPSHGAHWNPDGHRVAAHRLKRLLEHEGFP